MFNTSDPMADMLTRVRNAQMAHHANVEVPGSKIKFAVSEILAKYGYIKSTKWVDEGYQGKLVMELAYDKNNVPHIREIKRVSKPSRRLYVGVEEIPKVLNGLGIAVLSTSKGVMTGREARAANVGGELLCTVY